MSHPLSQEVEDQIVQACRTAMGDQLRSVTYLGPHAVEHLYTRQDLGQAEDSLAFLESEREGMRSEQAYGWSSLGEFRYTIRAFEDGYLGRVVAGDHSIYVTTDSLTASDFEEISETIRKLIESESQSE